MDPEPGRDLLKLAVVERHHGSGNLGLGLVRSTPSVCAGTS